jgi:crossover junction endodeoxyribonuclease RuvC
MGIDPSVNHTGWGIIETTAKRRRFKLLDSGVVKPKVSIKDERYGYIYNELNTYKKEHSPLDLILIERPTFENTDRGKEHWYGGGISILSMAAGVAIAIASIYTPYALITAWQWKGKTDKPTMRARIEEIFPQKRGKWVREDEWEAIGIALWGVAKEGEYEVAFGRSRELDHEQDKHQAVLRGILPRDQDWVQS